uniref:cell death regulator Aven isoform X2 n=1 Tax=Doryrhamphus excisus TaxID=161450 RepID=UPI0025AE4062|nr:cell death regulator Aven isoform X2 [Doryrhamphus excisus]
MVETTVIISAVNVEAEAEEANTEAGVTKTTTAVVVAEVTRRSDTRAKMKSTMFMRRITGQFSPGGRWSPTGTVMRTLRSRKQVTTCPLKEAPTTISFWRLQMSAHFVDLEALALFLKQVPLHQRLNLDAELLQVSTPAELPPMTSKQETPKVAAFTPPPTASEIPNKNNNNPNISRSLSLSASSDFQGPSGAAVAAPPADDVDEDLDQLLTLAKPVCDVSGGKSDSTESATALQKECDTVTEAVIEEKTEERKEEISHRGSAQEMTEEDLEDWLDSMIS